jgi:hypothetical protein
MRAVAEALILKAFGICTYECLYVAYNADANNIIMLSLPIDSAFGGNVNMLFSIGKEQ